MGSEPPFRVAFAVVLTTAVALSGAFRLRARRLGGTIPRAREGRGPLVLRLLFALPFYLGMIAYVVNPDWMRWSSLPLPTWLRWVGVAVAAAMLPLLVWVLLSLGTNISETYLTKADHRLVTHGPYRWVRHPLYAVALTAFLGLAVAAANGFLLVMGSAILIAMARLVVPREEAELMARFGDGYGAYRARTGAFVPRLGASRRLKAGGKVAGG